MYKHEVLLKGRQGLKNVDDVHGFLLLFFEYDIRDFIAFLDLVFFTIS